MSHFLLPSGASHPSLLPVIIGGGGAAGPFYWVDPANNIVGLFLNQSSPNGTGFGRPLQVLTCQALLE
jgi:hypothetical protein